MRLLAIAVAALAVVVALAFWIVTRAVAVPAAALPAYTPNVENGRVMFDIGGCVACHATPNPNTEKIEQTRLGGGLALASPFGTFYAPNISPDAKDGIGSWSEANFVTALWEGVTPGGQHLYPAFPYTSYRHMRLADVRDLFAYIKTLPPVQGRVRDHDVPFPFNIRRLVGLWKLLFLRGGPLADDSTKSAEWNRGAYLVNGPGHCAECHSPRNALGAVIESRRFAGGPLPDGKDWAPNITPTGLGHWSKDDIAWSQSDIANFFADGQFPDGDYAGGAMAAVIRETALLSGDDRAAMAAYIAGLPPRQGAKPPPKKPR